MRPPAVSAVCAALLLAVSAPARAQEPEPSETNEASSPPLSGEPDVPAYPPPSARWAVIGVGLATTALFYGGAAGISYAFPNAPGAQDLRTPIIGPWNAIANNGCPADEPDCSPVWVIMRTVGTAIGGAAQIGGLLIVLEGVFMPTQYYPEAPAKRPAIKPREPSPEPPKPSDKNLFWMPTPMALGTRGVGIGVVGNF